MLHTNEEEIAQLREEKGTLEAELEREREEREAGREEHRVEIEDLTQRHNQSLVTVQHLCTEVATLTQAKKELEDTLASCETEGQAHKDRADSLRFRLFQRTVLMLKMQRLADGISMTCSVDQLWERVQALEAEAGHEVGEDVWVSVVLGALDGKS
ncbi:hypothetical protein KIPB_003634 [Kipferlia bialata]|uniref:Uncharacterized protein n=1 Tax=Kipferlia bialata TaxID=797122 RepID=A0A9K3GFW4_9EUKA|nr:hypothetical protein KIPB_003634 [Kipferlia bialata]|eukprot:g3634.t1